MRLKKIWCGLLAAVLSLTVSTPLSSYGAAKFTDARGHWAERYINAAVNDGFVTGYPDGRFRPDKAVTRAEFAAMVNKALGNSGTANLSFYDVKGGSWHYNEVSKAVAAGYAAGYSDKSFRPDNPITRQEAAVMLSRIVTGDNNGNLRAYPDYKSIDDWAYEAMEKINGKGYIGAYSDGRIHPLDRLTRAQTAKILCDIIDSENIVTGNTVVKEDGTKLSGKIFTNNVTIHKDLDEDSATIENCVILGNLYVYGGGPDTVTISNTRVANCIVDKGEDPVRILAKGKTSIRELVADEASILQTGSLSGGLLGPGFSNVTVKESAEVTLKGEFPNVIVTGSNAEVILDSGTIRELTIASGGKYSDITIDKGASVSNATVNAEAYFHGSGTISHMSVNADNVTYETKPRNWTIASSVKTPRSEDPDFDIVFSPKNGASNVKTDTRITLTFQKAMEMSDGDEITGSDIEDFITIRKGASNGSKISFSASISSSDKVITITPDSLLSENTRYYVTLEEASIQDENGRENRKETIYFTTGAASPAVESIKVTTEKNAITANVVSNINGTAYLVVLPSASPAVNSSQVVNGHDAYNTPVPSNRKASGSVTAGASKAFTFTGLDSNTKYSVYAVINKSGLNSSVKSVTASTGKEVVKLTSLEVIPSVSGVPNPGNEISFQESTLTYSVTLNTGITSLRINAAGPGNISIDGNPPEAYGATKDVALSGANQSISVKIDKANADSSTYRIDVNRTDFAGISSLTVTADGNTLSDIGGMNYQLATNGTVRITVSATAADKFASVIMDGKSTIQSGSSAFYLEPSTSNQTWRFSIRSGAYEGNYTLTFLRPTSPVNH